MSLFLFILLLGLGIRILSLYFYTSFKLLIKNAFFLFNNRIISIRRWISSNISFELLIKNSFFLVNNRIICIRRWISSSNLFDKLFINSFCEYVIKFIYVILYIWVFMSTHVSAECENVLEDVFFNDLCISEDEILNGDKEDDGYSIENLDKVEVKGNSSDGEIKKEESVELSSEGGAPAGDSSGVTWRFASGFDAAKAASKASSCVDGPDADRIISPLPGSRETCRVLLTKDIAGLGKKGTVIYRFWNETTDTFLYRSYRDIYLVRFTPEYDLAAYKALSNYERGDRHQVGLDFMDHDRKGWAEAVHPADHYRDYREFERAKINLDEKELCKRYSISKPTASMMGGRTIITDYVKACTQSIYKFKYPENIGSGDFMRQEARDGFIILERTIRNMESVYGLKWLQIEEARVMFMVKYKTLVCTQQVAAWGVITESKGLCICQFTTGKGISTFYIDPDSIEFIKSKMKGKEDLLTTVELKGKKEYELMDRGKWKDNLWILKKKD